MKQKCFSLVVLLPVTFLLSIQTAGAQDPVLEAIKEATKQVIRAIDLQVQRLQNATVELQNIQKQVENVLSKLKLSEISDWTNRQRAQYQDYFDELWRVKSLITYYKQFSSIIAKQKQLFEEYKRAYGIIFQDTRFSPKEKDYIYGIYSAIVETSLKDVEDILTLTRSFTVQMSDADRLAMIEETAQAMDRHLTALRQFNQRNKLLSLQRAGSAYELDLIQRLYGGE